MEDQQQQQLHLHLANNLFLLQHSDIADIQKLTLRDDVTSYVISNDMALLYESLCLSAVLKFDEKVLDAMRVRINQEVKKLDEKIADAEENLRESEVHEAHFPYDTFIYYYSPCKHYFIG